MDGVLSGFSRLMATTRRGRRAMWGGVRARSRGARLGDGGGDAGVRMSGLRMTGGFARRRRAARNARGESWVFGRGMGFYFLIWVAEGVALAALGWRSGLGRGGLVGDSVTEVTKPPLLWQASRGRMSCHDGDRMD